MLTRIQSGYQNHCIRYPIPLTWIVRFAVSRRTPRINQPELHGLLPTCRSRERMARPDWSTSGRERYPLQTCSTADRAATMTHRLDPRFMPGETVLMFGLRGVVCLTLMVASFATPLQAQRTRSRVVIGKSLSEDKNPGPGQLNSPFGVDFDAKGNMYIVELAGGRVHRLDTSGEFTTLAGDGSKSYRGDGGPAAKATFNGMHNVAVTPQADVYIADSWNHCIRKIDHQTGMIHTIAGTGEPGYSGDGGPANQALFNYVMCASLNDRHDQLYVADLKNRRVRRIDLSTKIVATVAGNGNNGKPQDGRLATESPLIDPRAVAVDSQNNIYVLERSGHALRVVDSTGRIKTVVGTGTRGTRVGSGLETQLNSPKHLAIDAADNVIIADEANRRILKYEPRTDRVTILLGKGALKPNRGLSKPHGVCIHRDGTIYVVDTGHHRILSLKNR